MDGQRELVSLDREALLCAKEEVFDVNVLVAVVVYECMELAVKLVSVVA
jgi:hypothetical protein